MKKQALIQLLDDKIDPMLDWLEAQPKQNFSIQKTDGKWSNGEHLEHLRKSTRAVNKGMKYHKLFLRYKFGTNNRAERSYDDTVLKYKNQLKKTGVKAPKAFSPEGISNEDKSRLLSWFKEEKQTMQKIISKHSEAKLSKYILPHPLIGKLTFREWAYFTALHAEHHFVLMQKYNG